MVDSNNFASRISILLDGSRVDPEIMETLQEVVVEQHIHLPDMFRLRFHDPGFKLINEGPFDLAKRIKVEAEDNNGREVTLIEGEITALEPNFEEGMMAELVIDGYDVSHQLFRKCQSRSFLNQKDSDLAQEIARSANLKAQVDDTRTVYPYIFQDNKTNLRFLMERAWRIGYECFVREGTLFFRKPPQDGEAVELTWGDDLLSFQPRLNLAEQVDEVTVRGWDPERFHPILGRAQEGRIFPKVGETKNGAEWAKPFGRGNLVIVDQPVISQAEADVLAKARLDEINGAFLEATGRGFHCPGVRAGCMVKLKALGPRFSGRYHVTSVQHVYSGEGLITTFEVCGARTGLLQEALGPVRNSQRWPGVMIGIVTNNNDPDHLGRVKCRVPSLTDNAETDWARVLTIGGGPGAGVAIIPDIDDEVLLTFMNGNFSQPFVLGGLWNGKHQVPKQTKETSPGEIAQVRGLYSRGGHSIIMYDNDEAKVEIKTSSGYTIVLNDKQKNISISGPGQLKISMDEDITVEGKSNLNIKTTGDIHLESRGTIDLKATQLNLEGTTQATLKAATISVDGSALTEVKGGLIKLN